MISHNRYSSIENIFKRDHDTHKVTSGEFSLPEFEYLQDCKWVFTEKMDGMNIRVILDGEVDFRGRNDATQIPNPLAAHLLNTFDVEGVREESELYGNELCLYGEGVGLGIQKKGASYGPRQFFVLFDVRTKYGWASRRDVIDIAARLNIPVVPVLFMGTVTEAVTLVNSGITSTYGDFFAEGLVGRPEQELRNRYGKRITCKIKHKDFYSG